MNIYLRILLPVLLCILSLSVFKIQLDYYPISFALIISVINWDNSQLKPVYSLILNIISSFIIFLIFYITSLFLIKGLSPLLGENLSSLIGFTLGAFILAPIAVFLTYNKFIFLFPKTKLTIYLMIISIIILTIISITFFYCSDNGFYDFLKKFNVDHYVLWQIVMTLTIQLIIYQKELFSKKQD